MAKLNIEDKLSSFLDDLDRESSITPLLREYDKTMSKIDDKLDDAESPVFRKKLNHLRETLDKDFKNLADTLLKIDKTIEPYEKDV